jgi:hypothetical protein
MVSPMPEGDRVRVHQPPAAVTFPTLIRQGKPARFRSIMMKVTAQYEVTPTSAELIAGEQEQ